MTSPQCEYCGHTNRAGTQVCEVCDFPLGGDRTAGWADPSRDPRWAASEIAGPGGGWAPADAIPAPPFKGAGDVISPMLAVYRKHFTLVGILVLVTTVPQALLQFGIMGFGVGGPVSVTGSGGRGVLAAVVVSGLLLWLLALAASSLLSGSLTFAVVDLQRAGMSSAGKCLARGLKALPNVLLVSLLYSVIVVVGYVMLIVPGVIFSLMFAVSIPVAVVEGLGPVAALKRSHELTKGNKGLIFITFFLWGLLVTVLGWVVSWSFANGGNRDLLPTLLLQTAVIGMLNSSIHVLTVYVYLGLVREHGSGFQTNTFTS